MSPPGTGTGEFDPDSWLNARRSFVPALSFDRLADRSRAGIAKWRGDVRARFLRRLGPLPEKPCALDARSLDVLEIGRDYRREEVTFASREGLRVFAYFLTPLASSPPYPAVLCYNGHGPSGVNALVGLDSRGAAVGEDEYQHAFALQAVRRGYAVLAIEILGFGRRTIARTTTPGASSCQELAGAALMLGETLAGWRVHEGMRAIDYLLSRSEVDANRIATMGISGGGLDSFFHAAVDERIKAAVVSGFFNEFTACVMDLPHCIDNHIPGLRLDMEMSDIAGLIAPRALWCENGDGDPIFPVTAFHRAAAKAREIYGALGAEGRFAAEEFAGEHSFHGRECWAFLDANL